MAEKLITDKPTIIERPVTGIREVDGYIELLSRKLSLGIRNDYFQMITAFKPKSIFEAKNIFNKLIRHIKKQTPRL